MSRPKISEQTAIHSRKWKIRSSSKAKSFHARHKEYLYLWNMRTLHLNIPETVDFDDKEAIMAIASRLYEKGKLSLGQAAELAGLSKGAFMETLSNYGVSVFNYK